MTPEELDARHWKREFEAMQRLAEKLTEKTDRLRAALEFYAQGRHIMDTGERARRALANKEKQG